MIAQIAIPVILVLLLTAYYFDRTSWCRLSRGKRLSLWLLALLPAVVTVRMALLPDYFPHDTTSLELYLAMLTHLVVPFVLIGLCIILGRRLHCPRAGRWLGWALAIAEVAVWDWGCLVGFGQLEVVRVEYADADVPEAFDGYRIVQFSDAHVGSYTGRRTHLLQRAIDCVNAQNADMIVFTGDLQNMRPQEIEPHRQLLASLKARDGVYSVLGNHDYAKYVGGDEAEKAVQNRKTVEQEQSLGWTLLRNEHRIVRRGQDSLVIAGMENDGEGRFPQLGDMAATLRGVSPASFVVMLEHDPTSWRRKILPESHAQLTLSGHTHGGQCNFFGWSPAALRYSDCAGMYREGRRVLYVSRGLGGVVPFRFNTPAEVTEITLKKVKR